jgi:predicted metalloendopeptidase
MTRLAAFAVGVWALVACSTGNHGAAPGPAARPPVQKSGVDMRYRDDTVRPQDNLYRYLNGKWLDTFQLPADKGVYGSFVEVDDATQQQLRTLVAGLQAEPAGSADAKKLADLYASFMDEAEVEKLGAAPLKAELAAIDAVVSKSELAGLVARFNQTGADAPYDLSIGPDPKDSTRYAVSLTQSGLGLPDRDYYSKDDAKLKDAREKYRGHVERMLGLAGQADAAQRAAAIVALETQMAKIQWSRVENRDPLKTYNKVAVADLPRLMPGYDWQRYLKAAGLAGKIDYVIVRQPSYFTGLAELFANTPLAVWKSYFQWQQIVAAAPYLSKAFVDERFAFAGTVLRGIPENRPRWQRGMLLLNGAMGEAIGKLYVEQYFPAQNKARMELLVHNLIEAYRRDIVTLDWMSPDTKRGAQEKLAKLVTKIGYPSTWRDYTNLSIERNDLWGNVVRASEFEYRRRVGKLGTPIDRNEWFMTPQTVNAYYNPVMNEIVFPAAILQPPFFDANADDAVNYGAIVAVIGHEVSHGFDDKGSQYDGDGNLRDWFTPDDHAKFAAKARALVAQYDAYEPVPGYHVNGALTLGENIGDNSGLAVAYQAYELSLGGKPAPIIDGLSGPQRFYLGWVQVWRGKVRDDQAIERIKTDPHSPPAVRGIAPLSNQAGFYEAFGVKPGDKMYLPPAERVAIW